MLIAILRAGDVQIIDTEKTPVLFVCDAQQMERLSNAYAHMAASGEANKAHWAAPDYPNTEAGEMQRRREQFKLRDAIAAHPAAPMYFGDEKARTAGESQNIIVPRTKIAKPN